MSIEENKNSFDGQRGIYYGDNTPEPIPALEYGHIRNITDGIEVNVTDIDTGISALKKLESKFNNLEEKTNGMEGKGYCKEVLVDILSEYDKVKSEMDQMIGNSILFFESMKEQIVAADEEAACRMR